MADAQRRQHRHHPIRQVTKPPASSAKILKLRFSATTCTAKAQSRRGRPALFRADRIPGTPIQRGLRKKRSRQACICMRTERSHLQRRRRENGSAITANMFPIQRIPCRTASARFRPRIPPETGARGKSRTSALLMAGPMCSHSSAQPLDHDLTVTGPLAANLFRLNFRKRQRFHRQADRRISAERAEERLESG